MKKVVITIGLLFVGLWWAANALTDVYVKEQQLGIDLYYEAASLDYLPPSWFKPTDLDGAPQDASYWINEVLPYEEDRNENVYLVIPQLWLVTPVVSIPPGSNDYNRMINGQDIAINNYLKGGIIEYVGSVSPGYWGKLVHFWHSNYYKSDNGRYKSVFANLMALDQGDEVWYYVKQPGDRYKLFKYDITASYPSNPNNVKALSWDGDGADALVFGCYHGLDGRRMIEATLQGPAIGGPEDIKYAKLSEAWKAKVRAAVAKIGWLPRKIKSYQIVILFKRTEQARASIDDNDPKKEQKLLMLEFIEEKLAMIYPDPQ